MKIRNVEYPVLLPIMTNFVGVGINNFCSIETILNRICLMLQNLSLNEEIHNTLLQIPHCYQMFRWCIWNHKDHNVLQQSIVGDLTDKTLLEIIYDLFMNFHTYYAKKEDIHSYLFITISMLMILWLKFFCLLIIYSKCYCFVNLSHWERSKSVVIMLRHSSE